MNGRVGRTPSIRFIGRVALRLRPHGRKIDGRFVAQVLAALFKLGEEAAFAMLALEADSDRWRYVLYVNAPVDRRQAGPTQRMLSRTSAYVLPRLGQWIPRKRCVPADAYGRYVDRLQNAGQRMGDIKPVFSEPARRMVRSLFRRGRADRRLGCCRQSRSRNK